MTTKLELYNKAGGHLRQERLLDLTDDVVLKRELDAVYDATLQICLEEGLWKWSLRSIEISADPSIDTSDFGGFAYGFTLPTDFVRIANINADPYFRANSEVTDFEITGPGKTLYCDTESFFLKYVSNGATFGLDLASWPESFAEAVGARLAEKIAMRVTKSSDDHKACLAFGDRWMQQAKIRDAVDERIKAKPTGRLVCARAGGGRPKPNGPLWG